MFGASAAAIPCADRVVVSPDKPRPGLSRSRPQRVEGLGTVAVLALALDAWAKASGLTAGQLNELIAAVRAAGTRTTEEAA